ncbi:MAG: MBL fold metallo-hydrolase [Pseudomonadales bacterium]|nr:MBL fold metallo-hydrolase [Pseudomonadales bacterium]
MALIHHIDHPWVEGIRVGRTGPRGNYRINTSCIIYRLGDTIIDTGPSREWKLVQRFLSERGIQQALLTHYHEDHSGNCGHIHDCFNATIRAHINSHGRLSQGYDINLISRYLFGQISFTPLDAMATFPDSLTLHDGIALTPLHMPGHTDDLVCLHEPNRGWLFSGDLYVASQTRYAHEEENIGQHIESLNKAIALDFDELFCAHRGHLKNGKELLIKKRDFLSEFQQQVVHLHSQGQSIRAITRQLLGREDSVAWSSFHKMSKQHFVRACLKTLEPSL